MNTLYKTLGLIGFTALVGCQSPEKELAGTKETVAVSVAEVSVMDNQKSVSATGKLESSQGVNISTRFMGYIKDIPVKTGDSVKKGQTLLVVDGQDISAKKAQVEARIIQAETGLGIAERNYERYKSLKEKGSVSEAEYEQVEMQYQLARAEVDAANQMKREVDAQSAYLDIKSPFDGTVVQVMAKQGNMANPGMPLLRVESSDEMDAVVMIAEEDIQGLSQGAKAVLNVRSSNEELVGTVTELSPSSALTGGQYMAKIRIEKPGNSVKAGMYVTALIESEGESKNNRVFIPKSALVHKGQLTGVYTVGKSGTAILRWLTVGNEFGDQVEVLSGLSMGEQYVISSEGRLFNGVALTY